MIQRSFFKPLYWVYGDTSYLMQSRSVACCILSALEGEAYSARFQGTLIKLTLCVYVVKAHKVTEVLLYSLLTSALDRGHGPASRPKRFKPRNTAISTHWNRRLWSSRNFIPRIVHSVAYTQYRLGCFPRAFHSDWNKATFRATKLVLQRKTQKDVITEEILHHSVAWLFST